MKLFRSKKNKKRCNSIDWFTINCDGCSEEGTPYVICVEKDDIKVRPEGYDGKIQMYTICPRCGKQLVIPDNKVSQKVLNYIWEKFYEKGDCF